MAVPNVPFWISSVNTEAKSDGWVSSSALALGVGAPVWCSSLAGKSYITRTAMTIGHSNTNTPPANVYGFSISTAAPNGIAVGSLTPNTHEGKTITALYHNGQNGTNYVHVRFNTALTSNMLIEIRTNPSAGVLTSYTLTAGSTQYNLQWADLATQLRSLSSLTVDWRYV